MHREPLGANTGRPASTRPAKRRHTGNRVDCRRFAQYSTARPACKGQFQLGVIRCHKVPELSSTFTTIAGPMAFPAVTSIGG